VVERLAQGAAALEPAARAVAALVIGASLALAQPPVSQPWVLFLALPLLLWLVQGARGGWGGAGIGWLAGTGYFAAALHWIWEPFQVDADLHGWLAPFALAGMAGGLALFWAAAFGIARQLGTEGLAGALRLGALLAAAEVARSTVLTGFPWALVGYAWVETPVIQATALVGIQGLGFLTLLAALAVGAGLPLGGRLSGRYGGRLGAAAVAGLLVAAGWGYGAWRLAQLAPERAEPFVVRIVQPNAPQHLKWQPDMQAVFYQRHLEMTAAEGPMGRPDIVVWSETAVPFVLGFADEYQAEIAEAAGGAPVVLGIMRVELLEFEENWFNSLAILGEGGRTKAVYDKHHLVPFGEFIPLQQAIRRIGGPTIETLTRGGFTPGEGPHLVGAPGVPAFLPLICYEAIFPRHMWAPEGRPEWLVQVTNDAWFGTVSGPFQHYAQNRVRAIEQGLPLVRVANTGISAVVDPMGREVVRIGLGEAGFADAELPGPLAPTLFARTGERPALIAIILVFGLTFIKIRSGFWASTRP
jgi:apolipoprotein N-acyltransferase